MVILKKLLMIILKELKIFLIIFFFFSPIYLQFLLYLRNEFITPAKLSLRPAEIIACKSIAKMNIMSFSNIVGES